MSEKTEQATPFKLQKAKEQGQVNKSIDITNCIFLLTMLLSIWGFSSRTIAPLQSLIKYFLISSGQLSLTIENIHYLFNIIWKTISSLWLPVAFIGLASIVLTTLMQTGVVWSATPIKPDFKRLHLINGLKRIWSRKSLFTSLKSLMSLFVLIIFLGFTLRYQFAAIEALAHASVHVMATRAADMMYRILLNAVFLLICMALIDKCYTRWTFAKNQRMSKQEVKDEYKQREGDPKIKFKIKQLQQQLRFKTASLKNIQQADVIITNPTHLAIALQYEKTSMPAPKVICKAQGDVVRKVKKLAAQYQIPIIENKMFARSLFMTVELNQFISQSHFPAAVLIYRELYKNKGMLS